MLRSHKSFTDELSIGCPNVTLDFSKSRREEIMKYIEKGTEGFEAEKMKRIECERQSERNKKRIQRKIKGGMDRWIIKN